MWVAHLDSQVQGVMSVSVDEGTIYRSGSKIRISRPFVRELVSELGYVLLALLYDTDDG